MIRSTQVTDFDGIIALATASGLFEPEQTDLLAEMLQSPDKSDVWFTDEESGIPVGVAYLAPEKMTKGTRNLYWIAVDPDYQRGGRGKKILNYVQNWLIHRRQRILLIETAGVNEFDYVRKFYGDNGFEPEARIRDFYEPGVDKIVFRKSLDTSMKIVADREPSVGTKARQ